MLKTELLICVAAAVLMGCDDKTKTEPAPAAPAAAAQTTATTPAPAPAAKPIDSQIKDAVDQGKAQVSAAAEQGKAQAAQIAATAKTDAEKAAADAQEAANKAVSDAKSAFSATEVQSKLEEVKKYLMENKLDLADKSLKVLEDHKASIPASVYPQVEKLRKTIDLAKQGQGLGVSLPKF